MLDVRGLTISYGQHRAVDTVSLSVPTGEIMLIMGANGAGKSSLMRTIGGLQRPASGSIEAFGRDITRLSTTQRVAHGLAQVLERRGTFADLSVQENLELGAYLRRGHAHAAEVARDLEFVYALFPRLVERRALVASSLSGGEQQMLVIGRALMSKPRLLLLDEPSLGLAPLVVEEIARVLERLNRELKLTMLIAEQSIALGQGIAHRTAVLQRGRVVAQGASSEVGGDMLELYLDGVVADPGTASSNQN